MSVLGHLGIFGVPLALSALLWFGTTGGGKAGTVSWGWTLFLAMLAGSSYRAAGPPFSWMSDLVMDGVETVGDTFQGITMAGLCLTVVIIAMFKKLTLRQVAALGIVFWTVASGAGAGWGWAADHIHLIEQRWV